ncbi:thermonuclease family protein [Streptomyces sp. H27-D2]|uniref:thermonuclease family protein n=1 Tax=Streptomyces sp. H27-D2 TaxID=3046304 RepID=UPI002DBA6FAB|nr:thermonuclease family protein [Streptomyces sp. H27-D2]MEC4017891.1 thermonuclease family protein [Streptomyces sp. H27-D2]
MPMLLIEGSYKVLGASPDGDSVRFYPNDPDQWDLLRGRRVRRNRSGGAQLRLDGIDTLETHYRPLHGPELHQPPPFAQKAADELLTWLGFRDVTRNGQGIVTEAVPPEVPGYILTRSADKYGRCVAMAGRGAAPGSSGSRIPVDVPLLKETANHHQLTEGLAYPTFYRKLYVDLREEMSKAAKAARSAGKGLWPKDKTESGAKLDGLTSLTDSSVLMPKLFRRLADYFVLNDGDPSLSGFPDYLAQRDDRLFILSNGQSTGFDTIVDVTNGSIVRLNHPPEDLVFEEG